MSQSAAALQNQRSAGSIDDSTIDDVFDHTADAVAGIDQLHAYALRASAAASRAISEIEERSRVLDNALDEANTYLQRSSATAATLEAQLRAEIDEVVKQIRGRLQIISDDLEAKVGDASRVLEEISSIGTSITILAMNAAIEAAHAGEHGRGFNIVAQEVRALAQRTTTEARKAGKGMDLSAVQKDIAESVSTSNKLLDQLIDHVGSSLVQMRNLSEEMQTQLSHIGENNSVIREAVSEGVMAADRTNEKVEWSRDILQRLIGVAEARDLDGLNKLLMQHHIRKTDTHDTLDQILERGTIRIAVEPSLVGLSFRLNPNAPLRGLDIDYAEAFAKWLGVQCEFMTYPWDRCTELLDFGRRPGEAPADMMWSALAPSAAYEGVAYSESYTYAEFVLARRRGDKDIGSLYDLSGKVLGSSTDPSCFSSLEAAGVRWRGNADKGGGRVKLANLIAYADLTRVLDALANGAVDAFAIDRPVFYWACTAAESRWRDKIEIISGNIAAHPWQYAVGVKAEAKSYRLLAKINEFIAWFKTKPERAAIERLWQGQPVSCTRSYRDEPGHLIGEVELREMWGSEGRAN